MIDIDSIRQSKESKMNYQLIPGDCLDVMATLEAGSIDLVFTSPPYYNAMNYSTFDSYDDYLKFIERFIVRVKRVLSIDGFFILNTSPVIVERASRSDESRRLPIPFDTFQIAQSNGFKYIDEIIWEKPEGSAGRRGFKFAQNRRPCSYKPVPVTEYLFVLRHKDAPLIDKAIRKHGVDTISNSLVADGYERTNIWRIQPTCDDLHPAPFPYQLADNVVAYYSFIGDTILDPFLGSGTTGKVCAETGRNFIGIELDSNYFAIAQERIEAAYRKAQGLPRLGKPTDTQDLPLFT